MGECSVYVSLKIMTVKRVLGAAGTSHSVMQAAIILLPKSFAGGGENIVSARLNQWWSLSSSVLALASPLPGYFLLGA